MYKVIQSISIFLYNKNIPPFMKVHVHWINLIKNQIIQKCQSLEILKEKATRQRTHFFQLFDQKIMFNGFKMSSCRCRSYVQSKNMFGCPLTLILRFSGIFYVFKYKQKYSYTIMYEYENSPLSCEFSKIGLINFSHLNLFQVDVICTKQPHKSPRVLFLFLEPQL